MTDRIRTRLAAIAAIAALATLPATAAVAAQEAEESKTDPYARANHTWISIGGTVQTVAPNSFILDYDGGGTITVEMDDGDRDADGYQLLPGDEVVVHGMIDADAFQETTIEASSVHVPKLGTTFFASALDDEDHYPLPPIEGSTAKTATVLQGRVTEVRSDSFELNTGLESLTVEVGAMPYDPLDDEGYQRIESGDVVRVTGKSSNRLFEERKLEAETIVELSL